MELYHLLEGVESVVVGRESAADSGLVVAGAEKRAEC